MVQYRLARADPVLAALLALAVNLLEAIPDDVHRPEPDDSPGKTEADGHG